MYDVLTQEIAKIDLRLMDALEVSPGDFWQRLPFRSFTGASYPDFDVCAERLDRDFDFIIADQVFEHLLYPYRAGKNVFSMLRPGGRFVITTPFLIRRHDHPVDCSRWTDIGLKHFLEECGFPIEKIRTWSWGNRPCVLANLKRFRWAAEGRFKSLKNDPQFPVAVWGIAEK